MDRRWRRTFAIGVVAAGTVIGSVAVASGDDGEGRNDFRETLSGYQEDPLALSTTGTGDFHARISPSDDAITYTLEYSALEGTVTQAHIHLGGRHQSGGISVFLCSNLGNGPAGTQACPAAPATIEGVLVAADVIGPAGQGITAGQFDELVRAVRSGTTYVNVHSSLYQGGEIRAQLGDHSH
ncbi:MAG TPA: CHRD domain-containing protein [Jiangellaceae bacterium]|jgi:hypothetical protein|nr:CHRD domain-containing protein [Jiangellaceae bacterium]